MPFPAANDGGKVIHWRERSYFTAVAGNVLERWLPRSGAWLANWIVVAFLSFDHARPHFKRITNTAELEEPGVGRVGSGLPVGSLGSCRARSQDGGGRRGESRYRQD